MRDPVTRPVKSFDIVASPDRNGPGIPEAVYCRKPPGPVCANVPKELKSRRAGGEMLKNTLPLTFAGSSGPAFACLEPESKSKSVQTPVSAGGGRRRYPL